MRSLPLALAVLLGACHGAPTPHSAAHPIGSSERGFAGRSLTGEPLSFEPGGREDSRPTLLAFWASWCESCRAEAPALSRLHAEGRVPVLGINVDRDPPRGRRFQDEARLPFPSLSDPDLILADRYRVTGTPTLVVLDGAGRELARGHALDEEPLQRALATPPTPPAEDPGGDVDIDVDPVTTLLSPPAELPSVAARVVLMGTDVRLRVLTEDRPRAEAAIETAIDEMRRIEELMTDWKETSQVSAVNRAAGRHPVPVDAELFDLLVAAREVSELTAGKFDVTYAGVGTLWDFRADPPRVPSEEEIRSAVARVDYEALELDADARTAFLRRPGMRLGLGGIAKGYAVDRAVGVLEAAGLRDFAVNAGGDLAVRGRRAGELWRVSIRDPRDPDATAAVLPVSNASVVTSGDYARFFELDGVRYSHILDPDTGWPARGCRSVTVLATRTWWADALATGLFVLGPERALELLESLDGVEGLVVDAEGEVHLSSGLREHASLETPFDGRHEREAVLPPSSSERRAGLTRGIPFRLTRPLGRTSVHPPWHASSRPSSPP